MASSAAVNDANANAAFCLFDDVLRVVGDTAWTCEIHQRTTSNSLTLYSLAVLALKISRSCSVHKGGRRNCPRWADWAGLATEVLLVESRRRAARMGEGAKDVPRSWSKMLNNCTKFCSPVKEGLNRREDREATTCLVNWVQTAWQKQA